MPLLEVEEPVAKSHAANIEAAQVQRAGPNNRGSDRVTSNLQPALGYKAHTGNIHALATQSFTTVGVIRSRSFRLRVNQCGKVIEVRWDSLSSLLSSMFPLPECARYCRMILAIFRVMSG